MTYCSVVTVLTLCIYVAFCTGFNLLTPIFLLPYIIMDLRIFSWYKQRNALAITLS